MFHSWKLFPINNKIVLFEQLRKKINSHKSLFVEMISKEVGKPKKEAEMEVVDAINCIIYYCDQIKKIKSRNRMFYIDELQDTRFSIRFEPHGLVGLITPWNYPLSLPMWTIVPALLAGNTMIFKPSEESSLVGGKIDDIINDIFPEGVFNTIYGDAIVGRILVKSNLDKLFFTGSLKAGLSILKNVGFKPIVLELGGKDASIICNDANITLAAKGVVWGALNNAGQVCSSIEKVYVHNSIADSFLSALIKEVKKVRLGIDLGPLRSNRQLLIIENHVKDALKKGARILIGGKKKNCLGYFYEPTVLVNVTEKMKIMREETFGPVIPVKVMENNDEAIEQINMSKYGLGVVIWTNNISTGERIGAQLNVGMVWINEVNLPYYGGDFWGGTKMSGMRTSESKLFQCVRAKSYVSCCNKKKREWWYPYLP